MNRLPGVLHDRVDLIGKVVERDGLSWHAWAGATTVGVHGDEVMTFWPQREDLSPLTRATDPTMQKDHWRAGAALDGLDGAPTSHWQQGHEQR
jgi:hypothetical protein